MNQRLTIFLVCVLTCPACSSRAVVDGTLIGPVGPPGTACEVALHDEVGDPGAGLRCHEPDAPDSAVVRIGQRFECIAVAIEGAVDVTASCDGFEPYRSPAFTWSGRGFKPDVHHLGEIALKPATKRQER